MAIVEVPGGKIFRPGLSGSSIQVRPLAEQDPHRPVVAADVVKHEQDDVVIRAEPDGGDAQQRPGGQAEGAARFQLQVAGQRLLTRIVVQSTEIDRGEIDLR